MKKSKIILIVLLVIALIISGISICLKVVKDKKEQEIFDAIALEWEKSIPGEQPIFLTELDSLSNFECLSMVEEAKDYFVVQVCATSPDILNGVNEYQERVEGGNPTVAEMNEVLADIIKSSELRSSQHEIYVVRDNNGEYHVTFSESFIDAMFGYAYLDAIETLNSEWQTLIEGE